MLFWIVIGVFVALYAPIATIVSRQYAAPGAVAFVAVPLIVIALLGVAVVNRCSN